MKTNRTLCASHRWLGAVALLSLSLPNVASDWEISGSNTARYEYYESDGDESASPYQFEGDQYYDEFNLNFTRRFSPYETFRGQVYGVANHSDYRFGEDGFNAERVSLLYENGEGDMPYRVEAGDFYSYLSYRTMQRSLKGTQFELQSRPGGNGRRHSLVFFAGANQAQWDDVSFDRDGSAGASWLVEDTELGSLSFNMVYNQREADNANALDTEQWVASVAGESNFLLGAHNINIEGEYAYFDGDHEGDFSAQEGQDRDDQGYFGELVGNAYRQLNYRVRYEEYGYDYRPRGSVVVNDRRSYEGHMGWQFTGGLNLRGRWQTYQDRFDSVNQLDTEIVGLDLSGNLLSFLSDQVSGRVRAYREVVEDEFDTVDRTSDVLNFSLSSAIGSTRTAVVDFSLLDQSDSFSPETDALTREIGFEIVQQLNWGSFAGSIAPGLHYRDVDDGSNEGEEWRPSLAINMANLTHTFRASYDYLDQDRTSLTGQSLATQNIALHYHYSKGQHEFGVDANYYDRELDRLDNDTDASRVSLYWTYFLDSPASGSLVYQGPTKLSPEASLDGDLNINAELLTRLAPGQYLSDVTAKLGDADAPEPTYLPQAVIFEMRLLSQLEQRQRVAVSHYGDIIEKVGLIIDLEDDGSPQSTEQLFEQVKEDLIRKFGRPSRDYRQGEFNNALLGEVNTGRLIRVTEWDTNQGVLRFGIPRRMDGTVRMEVQHASYFPPPRDTLWSIESVR